MRLIELSSPDLDSGAVALAFSTQERLSQEPSYELELVSPRPDLDLDALLGNEISVSIDLGEGQRRDFHAYVFGGFDTGQMDDKYTYRLELHSWLSFLLQNSNCRIFQDLTVPQIVEQVFAGHHRADYRLELQGQYMPREYCVQYRESDLVFVKRLLEDEGLYFYVEHEAQRHVVVISDTQRFEDLPGRYANLRFLPDGEEHRAIAGREGIQRLQRTRKVRSNNVVLRDFNYFVPSQSLQVDAQLEQETLAGVQLEHYDYAAGYQDAQRGEWLARLRLESMQAEAQLLQGQANAMGMSVGRSFTLEGHPDQARNRRFYVVSVELAWLQDGPESTSRGRNFTCTYLSLADDQPFRPLRLTPKPRVPGTHSATVVGPPGSEVHTDKLARIRVHFHWDRYKSTEEDASCWMRIANAWHGKGWGFLAMPRVGQEVLISYIDGDLDRPLAVGIVYNGENPVPYDLPKDIRYSGLVSRSLKQGQVQHASQITFDDERGAERMMLHSERDMQDTVERNASTSVGNHHNISVGGILTMTTGLPSSGDTGSSASDEAPASAASPSSVSNSSTGIRNSTTGVSNSTTGVSNSVTGVRNSATGVQNSITGVRNSATGVQNSITGVRNSATGVQNSITGVRNSATGVSNSITGISNSATGIRNSATGISNSATGIRNSITGVSTSATGINASLTGMIISLTGVRISFTGMAIGFTGIRTSFTGVNASFTGMSTSFTGVSTSFTGLSTSFTGMSSSFNGMRTSLTGTSTTMTGVMSSMTGTSSNVTGTRTSMTGMSESMTGVNVTMTGMSRSMVGISYVTTGQRTSETGMSISSTGTETKTTGTETKVTGTETKTTGTSTRTTGTETKTTGTETKTTGTSNSTTGTETKTTGTETKTTGTLTKTTGTESSTTGRKDSNTGTSISYTGVKQSRVGMEIKQ